MKSKQHQAKASEKRGFKKLGKAHHSIEATKPAATRAKLEALSPEP